MLSAPSVVQGAGFLQEEASLDGDGVLTDITQVASFLCCPSLSSIYSQDPLEIFSRELCLGHLGDNKLLLSKTNLIYFILKPIVILKKEISLVTKISTERIPWCLIKASYMIFYSVLEKIYNVCLGAAWETPSLHLLKIINHLVFWYVWALVPGRGGDIQKRSWFTPKGSHRS